jgi:hypothetical protein
MLGGVLNVAAIRRAEMADILPSTSARFLSKLFRVCDQQHRGIHTAFIEGETAEHTAAIARFAP